MNECLPRRASVRRGGLALGGIHADVNGKVRADSSRRYMCGRFGVADSPPDSPLSLPPPFSTMLSTNSRDIMIKWPFI